MRSGQINISQQTNTTCHHQYSHHNYTKPHNDTMADKELTFAEVSEHNTKKDLYLVVHDKVYDCSSFVDEHP